METELRPDAFAPVEMAGKAQIIGIKKAGLDGFTIFLLAILAGAFIGAGAIFATTITAGAGSALPYGITRLLAGMAFSLGLILVIVGGAELFTGNTLMVMAWLDRKIQLKALLRNWTIVYLGNFAGAVLTAGLSFLSRQYLAGHGVVGATALATANGKMDIDFIQAVVLGMLANALVCLAVWLTYSARTTTDRVLAIVPPITAFVAAGYEHSIANMYFVPVALFIKEFAPAAFWEFTGMSAAQFPQLTWGNFLINNLLPVTIGNILGGAVMVGVIYWLAYLRKQSGRG